MKLTLTQLDALREVVNIGVGRAASVLNEMIGSHICLQIPALTILSPQQAKEELYKRLGLDGLSAVRLGFNGSLSGSAQLVFPTDSASKLVAAICNEDLGAADLDEVKIGALTEVGNIFISGLMGAISNLLEQDFNYSLPTYMEGIVAQLLTDNNFDPNATILLAQASFTIEQLQIEGEIIVIFKLGSFQALLAAIQETYGAE